ncbi:protein phosphatase, Mg2+/Mn2+ dependent, 1Lb [Puntigrus tetrazona]|uniref:protein phosphatase, Mg2+/Mn2+ dependent, 1Lb n=1 Tax=Puntigrus tetrazona TaxID=1606681 RepID=UPI001C88E26A|nr:protein phosphatase, Mg2+/Mn2+ dependent, 1Lb [Puntigrus tetrazona]XP_043115370.1 protein phosphatase, Mg2+/Mn2+ dependent, 1Lb [Puntigrus tetrazona]XP_043115371.1 protein phosphatase, Mg2+/Mn2+ dependent, 1Lb [Puntigrus tetrazona]
MSPLALLARTARCLLLRPQTLLLLGGSLALWSVLEVKSILRSSRDAVSLVKGRVAEMMHSEVMLHEEFSKTWQYRSGGAAVYSIQGRRERMEDRFHVLPDALNRSRTDIYGVFDGHGGETAAEYAKAHLPVMLRQQLQRYEKQKESGAPSPQSILKQQILDMDKEILEKLSASFDEAGTTCLVALLSEKELTVANVGDSRAVLCDQDGNAVPLSHDHKPYQLKERKRIKKAGGFISFNGSWRVQGVLAMSRSLGDYPLKNLNVLTPDPDVLTFDLDKLQPQFMILASDGLWDAFSNEEAVHFIKERLDEPHFGAKSIALQSFYRGCPDNITVMVVKFKKRGSKATG